MTNDKRLKDEMAKAAAGQPESAADCGMEEAFGLGLLDGPRRDLPVAEKSELARTDFTSGGQPQKPRLKLV